MNEETVFFLVKNQLPLETHLHTKLFFIMLLFFYEQLTEFVAQFEKCVWKKSRIAIFTLLV